jgi:hypothetical protein
LQSHLATLFVRSICETLRTDASDPWEQTLLPIAIIVMLH